MFWNSYKDLVDAWTIYYNSDEIFEEIADNETVYDKIKYEEFMRGL